MDVYFKVLPEHYNNHKVLIMPDNDILPLGDNINAFLLYADDSKAIVKVRIEADNLAGWLDETEDVEEQFGAVAAAYVGISSIYIGTTWADVCAAFPELTEPSVEVEPGVLMPLMQDTVILGESNGTNNLG